MRVSVSEMRYKDTRQTGGFVYKRRWAKINATMCALGETNSLGTVMLAQQLVFDFSRVGVWKVHSKSPLNLIEPFYVLLESSPVEILKMNESFLDTGAIDELVSVVVPVFFGMIAVTGLFGNSLVIFVVIANPQMRSTTNLLIVNLALADLLFVIFCIPFTATDYVLLQWPFGGTWCKCVQYLIVLFAHASIYTLVFMSLDRYLAVVHPIRSRSIRTERNTKMAIGILWAIILTASSPVAFMHGLDYCDETMTTLCCRFLDSDFPLVTFHITFMATSFILPLVLISGLYIRMIIRLWTTVVGNKLSSESQKGRKRVTRLVVVVVVAFASLWFPIQVILVLKSVDLYSADSTFKVLLQIFSQTLAYTSSCINPLLYAFLSENFRKAFRKAIPCFTKYNGYRSSCQDVPRRPSAAINCTTSI